MSTIDDEGEREEDWEDPDPSDQDLDDDPEAVSCPFCRKPVSELADVCPHCGNFISHDALQSEKRSIWKWVIVAILVAMFSGIIYFFVK